MVNQYGMPWPLSVKQAAKITIAQWKKQRKKNIIGMTSILAWVKSRAYHPLLFARITKYPHCGHKWPQWLRSTERSVADDDITTCNFALKCLKPKLLRVTVLLRYYAITARPILSPSFLLRYYGITARYFTLLFYWHQSYCKSMCFILITLLCYYGKVLHSSYWYQSNWKHKCFILITLSRYYGKVLHSSLLLASKLLWESNWAGFINPH